MNILGIETSCDETAAAVVEDGRNVHSSIIATSREAFSQSGGVIPEHAARQQVHAILPVLDQALMQAKMTLDDIDAIAVTRGPGLLGSLFVGTTTARTLAALSRKPLIGVHHTLGHLSSPWLETEEEIAFPVLTLSASGGHTELWVRASHTEGVLLGSTRDDAAGEAFDKGANILGLPYPGGPSISKAAEGGDREAFSFPHPLQNDPSFDFSFSGLKTALKYCVRDLPVPLAGIRRDLAASYEHALCLHLTERIERVMPRYPDVQEVHVVGGVSANGHLRELLCALCPNHQVRFPRRLAYCTDNAAMIAAAGYFLIQEYGDAAAAPFATEASLPLSALGPSHTTGPGGSP